VTAGDTNTAPEEEPKGLYGKYYGLRRSRDDSEVEGEYFILRETDPHAVAALRAYSQSVEEENRELSRDTQIQAGLWASAQSAGVSSDEFATRWYTSQWER
jgi:hypothetical protein